MFKKKEKEQAKNKKKHRSNNSFNRYHRFWVFKCREAWLQIPKNKHEQTFLAIFLICVESGFKKKKYFKSVRCLRHGGGYRSIYQGEPGVGNDSTQRERERAKESDRALTSNEICSSERDLQAFAIDLIVHPLDHGTEEEGCGSRS